MRSKVEELDSFYDGGSIHSGNTIILFNDPDDLISKLITIMCNYYFRKMSMPEGTKLEVKSKIQFGSSLSAIIPEYVSVTYRDRNFTQLLSFLNYSIVTKFFGINLPVDRIVAGDLGAQDTSKGNFDVGAIMDTKALIVKYVDFIEIYDIIGCTSYSAYPGDDEYDVRLDCTVNCTSERYRSAFENMVWLRAFLRKIKEDWFNSYASDDSNRDQIFSLVSLGIVIDPELHGIVPLDPKSLFLCYFEGKAPIIEVSKETAKQLLVDLFRIFRLSVPDDKVLESYYLSGFIVKDSILDSGNRSASAPRARNKASSDPQEFLVFIGKKYDYDPKILEWAEERIRRGVSFESIEQELEEFVKKLAALGDDYLAEPTQPTTQVEQTDSARPVKSAKQIEPVEPTSLNLEEFLELMGKKYNYDPKIIEMVKERLSVGRSFESIEQEIATLVEKLAALGDDYFEEPAQSAEPISSVPPLTFEKFLASLASMSTANPQFIADRYGSNNKFMNEAYKLSADGMQLEDVLRKFDDEIDSYQKAKTSMSYMEFRSIVDKKYSRSPFIMERIETLGRSGWSFEEILEEIDTQYEPLLKELGIEEEESSGYAKTVDAFGVSEKSKKMCSMSSFVEKDFANDPFIV